ncbi:MAG: GNAT family N-acetyltransferase [Kurthia sp.]|nr:GNAT family N-acetyltransferase [Candidatus Kurthia equi]
MEVYYATDKELEQIVPLFTDYLKFYGRTPEYEDIVKFLGKRLRNEESIFLYVRYKENVIGFIQLYPSFSSLSLKRSYILNDLYVAPEYRKLGAAQALMEEAFAFCQQAGAVYVSLETHPDNISAQKLYEKIGMSRDDEFWHYTKSFL